MAEEMVNGIRVLLLGESGPALGSEADALDVIGQTYGTEIDAIVVPADRFTPEFFDLSTKLAGGFMQKFQNYRMRLVVLGDIEAHMTRSTALTDFVRETNRVGRHLFVPDRAALDRQLRALA